MQATVRGDKGPRQERQTGQHHFFCFFNWEELHSFYELNHVASIYCSGFGVIFLSLFGCHCKYDHVTLADLQLLEVNQTSFECKICCAAGVYAYPR